eukprot:scaffold90498_cov38-Prasinocladus_malaysianus.AAC.1
MGYPQGLGKKPLGVLDCACESGCRSGGQKGQSAFLRGHAQAAFRDEIYLPVMRHNETCAPRPSMLS